MSDSYEEMKCMTCNKPLDVWFVSSGAPFNHWYMCSECKQNEESLESDSE